MANIEYEGLKISGTKWLIIFPLIGTIIGGLWGGFELYKRYEDMEQTISQYKAPDMSGFDKRLDVMNTSISSLKELVADAQETARDIRTDIKGDVNDVLDQISAIDKRSRADGLEVRQTMRSAEKEIRELINTTDKR